MTIMWLLAQYSFEPDQTPIAVSAKALDKLIRLSDALVGTHDRFGISISATMPGWSSGSARRIRRR